MQQNREGRGKDQAKRERRPRAHMATRPSSGDNAKHGAESAEVTAINTNTNTYTNREIKKHNYGCSNGLSNIILRYVPVSAFLSSSLSRFKWIELTRSLTLSAATPIAIVLSVTLPRFDGTEEGVSEKVTDRLFPDR